MKTTARAVCMHGGAALLIIGLFYSFPWGTGKSPMTARTASSGNQTANLSSTTLTEDVDYALQVQAERNPNHPRYPSWTPERGEFIERLHESGSLPPEKWEAYAKGSVDVRLELRRSVRRGDPIPVRLHIYPRLGPKTRFRIEYSETFKLRGETKMIGGTGIHATEITSNSGGDTPWFNLAVDANAAAQVANGPQFITGVMEISVFEAASDSKEPLARRQINFFESYHQWPENQAAKKLTYGLAGRQILEKGVAIKSLSFGGWGRDRGSLEFGPVNLPQKVQCNDWFRAGEREWQITNDLEFVPGQGSNGISGFTLAEFDATTVDVILRPAYIDEWYPYTVYPRDVSQYEVVFHDVAVQYALPQCDRR